LIKSLYFTVAVGFLCGRVCQGLTFRNATSLRYVFVLGNNIELARSLLQA